MTQIKLLVITSDNHMSATRRAELTARVQLIAEKVGAELLVLGPGQCADLIITPAIPSKATAGEIKAALRCAGKSNIPAFVPSVRCGRGENGPELQVTGPSRTFSREHINSMMGMSHTGDDDLAKLRDGIERLHKRIEDSLQKVGAATTRLRDEGEPLAAIQGEALSFSLDPLEQAIESTVRMVRDEHQQMAETGAQRDTALCDRLGSHLDALLAEQLKRVISDGVQINEGA